MSQNYNHAICPTFYIVLTKYIQNATLKKYIKYGTYLLVLYLLGPKKWMLSVLFGPKNWMVLSLFGPKKWIVLALFGPKKWMILCPIWSQKGMVSHLFGSKEWMIWSLFAPTIKWYRLYLVPRSEWHQQFWPLEVNGNGSVFPPEVYGIGLF